MAKRWKRHRLTPPLVEKEKFMIEHTIIKHAEPAKVVTPQQHAHYAALDSQANNRVFWPKAKYDNYIKSLICRGVVKDVNVTTKYLMQGTIAGYLDCPDAGINFYGREVPCCIKIKLDNSQFTSNYAEDELTLKE